MPLARSTFFRHALRAAGLLGAGMVLGGGCYVSNAGFPPPTHSFYFPTGLAVSPGRTALYVANSDFDLQYNGGTVQVLDLTWVRPKLATLLDGLRQGFSAKKACARVEVELLKEKPQQLRQNDNSFHAPG